MRRERVKAALKAIEDRNGRLTAQAVVSAAKAARHPLHKYFTWDDKKAGHQHRLWQARELIKRVEVRVEVENIAIRSVAYVRDPGVGPRQGYRSVVAIRREPDSARAALVEAFAIITAQLRRARDLGAALDLSNDVEVLLQNVERLDERVRQIAA